jgi:hypothetical protein
MVVEVEDTVGLSYNSDLGYAAAFILSPNMISYVSFGTNFYETF